MINRNELSKIGWKPFFEQELFEAMRTLELEDGADAIIGRVASIDRHICTLWTEDEEPRTAYIPQAMFDQTDDAFDLPIVGDWVIGIPKYDRVEIERIFVRSSHLARSAAGQQTKPQPIVANVDHVWVVTSADSDFSVKRIERYLAAIWAGDCEPVIVITKTDLDHDAEVLASIHDVIPNTVPVIRTHMHAEDTDDLKTWIEPGSTVALVGSSGVGKSTLINRLADVRQETGGVRESDGKGRHTTTRRNLIRVPEGGIIIDTPGMREFGVWNVEEGVARMYADIEALAERCRFRDCEHESEPGCAVQAAIDSGEISTDRYASYVSLKRENAYLQRRADQTRAKEKTFKSISKSMRKRNKLHRKLGLKDF